MVERAGVLSRYSVAFTALLRAQDAQGRASQRQ
jgi:hypothetical protein